MLHFVSLQLNNLLFCSWTVCCLQQEQKNCLGALKSLNISVFNCPITTRRVTVLELFSVFNSNFKELLVLIKESLLTTYTDILARDNTPNMLAILIM